MDSDTRIIKEMIRHSCDTFQNWKKGIKKRKNIGFNIQYKPHPKKK